MTTTRKLPNWMTDMSKNSTNTSETGNEFEKPVLFFNGLINYCSNLAECGLACEKIMLHLDKVEELALGFDLEWPVDYKKGSGRTSLIQICPDEGICHLFHVNEWERLPKIFLHLIQHPKVRLVGLNIRNDLYKLGRDFNISVKTVLEKNSVELGELANERLNCAQCWSLERLVLHLLKKNLAKTKSVRLSKWNAVDLSENQLRYAATDAFASLLVYQHLKINAANIISSN